MSEYNKMLKKQIRQLQLDTIRLRRVNKWLRKENEKMDTQ